MAFEREDGYKVSYECSELIAELKEDIAEFGGETIVAVWCTVKMGVTLFVNYDFIDDEEPITEEEISENETLTYMTMTALLVLLEKQNTVL